MNSAVVILIQVEFYQLIFEIFYFMLVVFFVLSMQT